MTLQQPKLTFQQPIEQPDNITILMTNMDSGDTVIALPQTGNLWVAYEYQQEPAQTVYIWHQDGTTTTVQPGFQTIPVSEGDTLVYGLRQPTDSIKLGWGYE
jgi:hypothetical protein